MYNMKSYRSLVLQENEVEDTSGTHAHKCISIYLIRHEELGEEQ